MAESTQSTGSLLGEKAKALYSRLESARWVSLERARDCSALTLPALLPSQWVNDTTEIPEPYQSVGARGVNNLSSKLLLALFPPGTPFFRLRVKRQVADELGEMLSDVETQLASVEQTINDSVETSHARPLMSEVLKHLIVTGNGLLHVPSLEDTRFFRMDQYVILRDAMDRPLRTVVKETTVAMALTEEVRIECQVPTDTNVDKPKADNAKVDIYTVICWDYITKKVDSHQEINDIMVPGSAGNRPLEKSEWIPLRWIAVPGRDYGRGHVEEYIGDLRSLEGLSEAIVQFAQVAAKIVMLVHPNSTTDVAAINNAESGDAVVGSKVDIDVLQLEKQADFQVAERVAEKIEQRLSYAFLLSTGTTREAERVTAEEIRATAQELEDALGGVYTVLAQELQLPYVRRLMAAAQQAGDIPQLPPKAFDPVIVTGFEALGRNQALNRLRQYFQDLSETFGPQVLAQRANFTEIAKRFGVGYGVEDYATLWISDADFQKQQQQQSMQEAMTKAAPAAAGPLVKAAVGQSQ